MPTIAQRRRQQQQHRRQNSTPSALEPAKTHNQKNPPQASTGRPAGAGHRRGLSLDTRRQHIRHRSNASVSGISTPITAPVGGGDGARDFGTVSMSTNTGLAGNPQQQHHVLREMQQQRLQAGPGTHANAQNFSFPATGQQQGGMYQGYNPQYIPQQDYMVSPHGNPQAQNFEQSFDPSQMMAMQRTRANYANSVDAVNGEYFAANSALSTPTYAEFPEALGSAQGWTSEGETVSTRRTSRRISNGIMDRVNKFETLTDVTQGAGTPPNQNANGEQILQQEGGGASTNRTIDCLSTRQVETNGTNEEEQRPSRFAEGYDESMEETIKPGKKTSPRGSTIFDDMRRQAEEPQAQRHQAIAPAPGPQRSHTMPTSMDSMVMPSAESFMDMNQFSNDFMKMHTGYHDPNNPLSAGSTGYDNLPDLRPHDSISQPTSPHGRGHHRRTDSVASLASAASISSINIEETRTSTGITLDDIATYIRGPDPSDNKWVCLYEDCGKRFGRKENIKSHVQTHLNDRQYQCPSCQKCFVRQHDLKRHAKIHTGIKPYPCECGNSFARHDALTRHRQRGMCVGAFDGVVRKVVKRGRPRKHRPDMDERADKSSRTRKKNLSISSTSSAGAYSDDSSGPMSPQQGFDVLGSNFDLMDVAIDSATLNGVPPMMGRMGGPELHSYTNSPESANSYVSPGAIMEQGPSLPPHPHSPAKSTASHFAEPPELSQSSSPPACRLFDSDAGAPPSESMAFPVGAHGHVQSLPAALMGGLGEQDEELMKAFTHDEGIVPIERDPGMFGVSKFDEEFAVSMMGSESDMFFGAN